MNIRAHNLKDFKKQLKALIKENEIIRFEIKVMKDSYDYLALLDNKVLLVGIPDSKQIEDDEFQVSYRSINRKRHTLKIFISKRLKSQGPNNNGVH